MPSLSEILKSKIGKGLVSKAYVANLMGVSEKTIENYMAGKREPKQEGLVKLAEILKFELSELSEQNVPREKERQEGALKAVTTTSVTTDLITTLHAWLAEKDKLIQEKDKVIAEKERLLKVNSDFVRVRLNSLLAYQQVMYEQMLERIAREDRKKVADVKDRIDKILSGILHEIVGMHIVD